jgi:predicted nuclease with TOPRIM domain
MEEEIKYESTTEISNRIAEYEKEEIQLLSKKLKLQQPLMDINTRLEIIKREKSILNKDYWRAKS